MNHPSWLPRKQKWPVHLVLVLAPVVLVVALLRILFSDGEQERLSSLDERLRSVCERDPALTEVSTLVGPVAGRYQDGKGCIWREGAASTQLVARRASMSLNAWTKSLGQIDATTRSSHAVEVKLVRTSAHCTAAFDNAMGGVIEVEALTELDTDCRRTLTAAAAIADAMG